MVLHEEGCFSLLIAMPKKERPPALAESIFASDVEAADNGVVTEDLQIPVHNTFIQFGSPGTSDKKLLSTAPAWIGSSFQSLMQSAMRSTLQVSSLNTPSEDLYSGGAGPSNLLPHCWPSPKKVAVMRYSLSTSSARAAGLDDPDATVAHCEARLDRWWQSSSANRSEEDEHAKGNVKRAPQLGCAIVPASLPSVGSALHTEGLCKRCCFFPKGRCLNGEQCEFCHFEHEKRRRKKKKKKKGTQHDSSDSEEGDAPLQASSAVNGSVQSAASLAPAHVEIPGLPSHPLQESSSAGAAAWKHHGGTLPTVPSAATASLATLPQQARRLSLCEARCQKPCVCPPGAGAVAPPGRSDGSCHSSSFDTVAPSVGYVVNPYGRVVQFVEPKFSTQAPVFIRPHEGVGMMVCSTSGTGGLPPPR